MCGTENGSSLHAGVGEAMTDAKLTDADIRQRIETAEVSHHWSIDGRRLRVGEISRCLHCGMTTRRINDKAREYVTRDGVWMPEPGVCVKGEGVDGTRTAIIDEFLAPYVEALTAARAEVARLKATVEQLHKTVATSSRNYASGVAEAREDGAARERAAAVSFLRLGATALDALGRAADAYKTHEMAEQLEAGRHLTDGGAVGEEERGDG